MFPFSSFFHSADAIITYKIICESSHIEEELYCVHVQLYSKKTPSQLFSKNWYLTFLTYVNVQTSSANANKWH